MITTSLWADQKLDLSNPGFENGTTSWHVSDKGMSTITPDSARNGLKGLRVTDTSETDGSSVISHALNAVPGQKYRLHFWGRILEGDGIALYLVFLDNQGKRLNNQDNKNEAMLPLSATNKEWKRYTLDGTAPEKTAKISVWIHSFTKKTVTADIDDLTLLQLNP